MTCSFVPPYLLEQIGATATLSVDAEMRAVRAAPLPRPPATPTAAAPGALAEVPDWTIHSADGTTSLPGRAVRSKGQPDTGDAAVDEGADGTDAALRFFSEVFGRSSYDGAGAAVSATVHYGRDYDNAFWDGRQLVFGDGDGRVFERFTKPVDVLAHELTHAVVEHSARLVYRDQPGALNESLSDVFASCLKQRLLGQSADEADWLVGEGIFLPSVKGV